MKDIIKTYEREIEDDIPMYVLMTDDEMFFMRYTEKGKIETTEDPIHADTWGNDEHAAFELVEYAERFKKTKKKWRVVARYETQKLTFRFTER